jgi:superfamily I DNA/RNA helicase
MAQSDPERDNKISKATLQQGHLPVLMSYESAQDEAEAIAAEILRLVRNSHGLLKLGDIAILSEQVPSRAKRSPC